MSLIKYVAFDPATGRILSQGEALPASLAVDYGERLDVSVAYLEGDGRLHYIQNGALVDKTAMDTAHTVSGLTVTFSTLPIGAEVSVAGASVVVDSDPTVIEFSVAGIYRFFIRKSAPYFDETLEVTVG